MLKKITKWETEDGTVFDTQEEAEDYMFEQDKEVMAQKTEQERADFEAWAISKGHDLAKEEASDGYFYSDANEMWEAWQAARRAPAVPVQMPEPVAYMLLDKDEPEAGFIFAKDSSAEWYGSEPLYTEQQVVSLLKSQGIYVKTSK